MQERFIEEVPRSKEALLRVLREESDPQRRADALSLLAYLRSGPEVAKTAEEGLWDPDDRVREAAMRIFSDIVVYRKGVSVPVAKIAEAMDYPSVDDRTRALAVMLGLASHPRYSDFVLQKASAQVLKLLRMKNSSNHDMALTTLRMLSSKDYGGSDFAAWEDWVKKARKGEIAVPKKR